jgi:hypothetical protein
LEIKTAPLDRIDIELLERFVESRAGATYAARLAEVAARHRRTLLRRDASIEDIRFAQGAIEALEFVTDLPRSLYKSVVDPTGQKEVSRAQRPERPVR